MFSLDPNFEQIINENIDTRLSTNITSYHRNAALARATTRTLMNLPRSESTIVHA